MLHLGKVYSSTFLGSSWIKKHIGNIYRPPKNNNNNQSKALFIEEFSPIVDIKRNNMSHGMIVGDFNRNLLQILEREKVGDFFDLICVNGFLPKITLPMRFAKKSCSLIDQIFWRFPEAHINFSSAIIMSIISDHNPCIVIVNLLKAKSHNPKFVKKEQIQWNCSEKISRGTNELWEVTPNW